MDADVVVIGAGHQGLVAATVLAEAGLDVVVVDPAEEPGGAVRSGDVTGTGAIHDYWATNVNLFLGSPYFAAHSAELAQAGLALRTGDHPYASAFPDGGSLRVYQDTAATAAMWADHSPADLAGWRALEDLFDDFTNAYFPLYGNPVASRAGLAGLVPTWRARGRAGTVELAQILLSSTRGLAARYFETAEAASLLAAWGMHLDYAPDVAGGAIFPLLECFLDQRNGMSVVEGGAGRLGRAMATVLRARGGALRLGVSVERVEVGPSGADGVLLADGSRIRTRVGVISTVVLPVLVRSLLDPDTVPPATRAAAEHYRFGPGTVMVHLLMDGPVPWADQRLAPFSYVHLGPYLDDMARTYQQAMAGVVPDEPLLVVAQTSVVDPSRATGGRHVVWLQARMFPGTIRGDAGAAGSSDLSGQSWSQAGPTIADRVIAKLDRYAPGASSRVVASAVMTPADLEAANANLVGGDSVSGSHHLDQLIVRPSVAGTRYRSGIPRLWLAGAGTWPGGGLNGISGGLAASQLLAEHRGLSGRRLLTFDQTRQRLRRRPPEPAVRPSTPSQSS